MRITIANYWNRIFLILAILTSFTMFACEEEEDDNSSSLKPTADFSFLPLSPKKGESVKFTNLSQNADSYQWSSSPAGFSSTEKDPSFTFNNAGNFEITLVAKKGSESATTKKSISVSENNVLAADFSFSPLNPKKGESVKFTNLSQNADSYQWSSSPAGFSSTEKDPSFTFNNAGNFEITLVAKKGSESATIKKSISVSNSTDNLPVANFSFSPQTPKINQEVSFSNTSQNATSYEWSSSPAGFSSTLANPTFKFTSAGTYQITLKATSSTGSNAVTKTITVEEETTSGDACNIGCYVVETNTVTAGVSTLAKYTYTTINGVKVIIKINLSSAGITTITDFEYDAQGRKIKDKVTSNSFVSVYNVYEYEGATKNPKKSTAYDNANKMLGYTLYYYDGQGRTIRVESYDANAKRTGYSTFENFTSKGFPQLEKRFDANNALNTTVTTTYQDCLSTSIIAKDASGKIVSEVSNQIDAKGLLRKSVSKIYSVITVISNTDYKYDCD